MCEPRHVLSLLYSTRRTFDDVRLFRLRLGMLLFQKQNILKTNIGSHNVFCGLVVSTITIQLFQTLTDNDKNKAAAHRPSLLHR